MPMTWLLHEFQTESVCDECIFQLWRVNGMNKFRDVNKCRRSGCWQLIWSSWKWLIIRITVELWVIFGCSLHWTITIERSRSWIFNFFFLNKNAISLNICKKTNKLLNFISFNFKLLTIDLTYILTRKKNRIKICQNDSQQC